MLTMKNKKQPSKDQHVSGFMLRLPEIYRTQLRKLRLQSRRPMTTDVQIALEKYLAEFKLWPPEESPDA
jgi:hypothetical protein